MTDLLPIAVALAGSAALAAAIPEALIMRALSRRYSFRGRAAYLYAGFLLFVTLKSVISLSLITIFGVCYLKAKRRFGLLVSNSPDAWGFRHTDADGAAHQRLSSLAVAWSDARISGVSNRAIYPAVSDYMYRATMVAYVARNGGDLEPEELEFFDDMLDAIRRLTRQAIAKKAARAPKLTRQVQQMIGGNSAPQASMKKWVAGWRKPAPTPDPGLVVLAEPAAEPAAQLLASPHAELRQLGEAIRQLQSDALLWPLVSEADRRFVNAAVLDPSERMARATAQTARLGAMEAATLTEASLAVAAVRQRTEDQRTAAAQLTSETIATVMRQRLAELPPR